MRPAPPLWCLPAVLGAARPGRSLRQLPLEFTAHHATEPWRIDAPVSVGIQACRRGTHSSLSQASEEATEPVHRRESIMRAEDVDGYMLSEELDCLRQHAAKAQLVVEIGCWHGR